MFGNSSGDPERDSETQEITSAGQADVFSIKVGDCLHAVQNDTVEAVPVVPVDMRRKWLDMSSATVADIEAFGPRAGDILIVNGDYNRTPHHMLYVVATRYAPTDVMSGALAALDELTIAKGAR